MVIDGLIVVAVGLTVGIGLATNSEARLRVLESLGYGWVPTVLWLSAIIVGLRHHPRFTVKHWRWWLVTATMVVVIASVLSFFRPGDGTIAEVSLGGRWGSAVGGTPLAVGIGKLLAISVLSSVVLFPRRMGYFYARSFALVGRGTRLVANRIPLLNSDTSLLRRLLRGLFGNRYFSKPFDRVPVWFSGTAKATSSASSEPGSAAPNETTEPLLPYSSSDPDGTSGSETIEALFVRVLEPQNDAADTSAANAPTWQLPSVDLLTAPEPFESLGSDLESEARHIERTFAGYGIAVNVESWQAGPRIVRYGLAPHGLKQKDADFDGPQGRVVRVQSILALEKDVALALGLPSLRIQPTRPGESLLGIEVPVTPARRVYLSQVTEADSAIYDVALPIALGQDVGGSAELVDLAALPHLLIAGATGSGKSACINSIIGSLLFAKAPHQIRLVLVDPKGVELTPYNGVPHLVSPVISDLAGFKGALKGLITVMQRRYKRMERLGTRDIHTYNTKAKRRMPHVVLIVDELAELMITGGREIEGGLVRLAQMGRAIGIHLVLATQRPTVDVVTGHLKANIPTRIAFAVTSQTDSRVILDATGAENLLGMGDMLLLERGATQPRRIQGTFLDDDEIHRLVEFWTKPPQDESQDSL
jgi:hypothetical protein